jgi:hypothetical protein
MEILFICGAVILVAVIIIAKLSSGSTPREPAGKGLEDSFTAVSLLNQSEARLLAVLDTVVGPVFGAKARTFTQVSYGEFLKGNTRSAFAKVNQKRADFVVADAAGTVLCVIEYQGSGHYGRGPVAREKAEKNDTVKRAALASASVPMVEVPAKFTAESVRGQLKGVRPLQGI